VKFMTGNAQIQHRILAVLASLADRCLLIDDLLAQTGLTRRQLSDGAAGLIARGYAVRRERGCFQVTAEGAVAHADGVALTSGPNGPMERKRSNNSALRTRLWRAMRMKRKFTLAELLVLAESGTEKAAHSNAARYVRGLVAAGYLAELRRAKGDCPGSNGWKRYSLLRDSGPLMPMLRAGGASVYDPNTGTVYPCAPSPDVVAGGGS
jgi:hypothetical protein